MNDLVVFYSLTGNHKKAAEIVSKMLQCNSVEIEETFKRSKAGLFKYILNGFEAATKKTSEIKSVNEDFLSYERVVFLTPVWAGKLPPPSLAFLDKYKDKIKKIVVIAISGRGNGNRSFGKDVEETLERKPDIFLQFSEKEFKNGEFEKN
jgi:flavodoxin